MADLKEVNSKEKFIDDVQIESLPLEVTQEQIIFERRTMRFVDWRMLPVLALLYSFALIDRINLGAANTAGMGVDLKLEKGARFNIASCLYFVPYILLQVPGNLFVRKIGVRTLLTSCLVGWGASQLGMGWVPTWGYLTLCRILLGAFEATFFPAIVFVISTWHGINDMKFKKVALTMSGVSPILAWAISKLHGKCGLAGWRWIFIVEGAFTLFLAIVSWLFIPDFPHKNRFLTPEQTEVVLKRVEDDRGDSIPDPLTFQTVRVHLSDWTLWAYGIMFLCSTMPAYAAAYFISIILKGMGFDSTHALLLSAPPYAPTLVSALFFAWLSDKYRHRSGFIAIQAIACITGLCLTAFAKDSAVRYFGIFVSNAGNAGTIPGILAYGSNNVVSHSKRSVQTALTISFGGIGGILATTVFRAKDAPRYHPGLGATMGSQVLLLIILGITNIHFHRQNTLVRQGKRTKPLEGQPGFFYTL